MDAHTAHTLPNIGVDRLARMALKSLLRKVIPLLNFPQRSRDDFPLKLFKFESVFRKLN